MSRHHTLSTRETCHEKMPSFFGSPKHEGYVFKTSKMVEVTPKNAGQVGYHRLFRSLSFPRITPTTPHISSNTPAAPKSTLTDQCQSVRRRRLEVAAWSFFGRFGAMTTWRIIPFSKWLITMVGKPPK